MSLQLHVVTISGKRYLQHLADLACVGGCEETLHYDDYVLSGNADSLLTWAQYTVMLWFPKHAVPVRNGYVCAFRNKL